jgi:AcrR family transcriptional regulator
MATKTAKGELSRENLLDAAARVFRQRGYNATTIRDIAREAGVALGGLYRHFSSKEEFIAVSLTDGMKDIRADVQRAVGALPPGSSLHEKIKAGIKAQMLATRKRGDSYDLAVRYERASTAPASIWKPYRHEVEEYRVFWKRLLDQARETGQIRGDSNTSMLTFFLLGSVIWVNQWHRPTRRSLDKVAGDFADFFLQGALVRGARTATRKTPRKNPASLDKSAASRA